MAAPEEWKNLLAPDEEILWQGAPSAKLRSEFQLPEDLLSAVLTVGLSILLMLGAVADVIYVRIFGLALLGLGLFQIFGVHHWKAYVRHKTFYTLTNQNAFIAVEMFGRRFLRSYAILPSTRLEYELNEPGSIFFAVKRIITRHGTRTKKIGFEMIDDAQDVVCFMLESQQSELAEAENQDA
jgi:hypothetical protein